MAAELQHTADLSDRAEVLDVSFQFLNTKKQCDVESTFSLKVATEALQLNSWFVGGTVNNTSVFIVCSQVLSHNVNFLRLRELGSREY